MDTKRISIVAPFFNFMPNLRVEHDWQGHLTGARAISRPEIVLRRVDELLNFAVGGEQRQAELVVRDVHGKM